MKQALRCAIALAALSACGAQAADMPVKVPVPVAVFSWTGCYVGGNAGFKWGRYKDQVDEPLFTDLIDLGSSNPSSGVAGAQAGCRWENSEHWVWGFEGEFDFSRLNSTFINTRPLTVPLTRGIFVPGDTFTDRARNEAFAKMMFGHAFDRTLIYLTAGIGSTQMSMDANFIPVTILRQPFPGAFFSSTKTVVGVTGGFGAAYALTNNWEVGAEYRYTSYARTDFALGNLAATCAGTTCVSTQPMGHKELTTNEVLFRLNYRFGGGAVIAKY
jgi:outer membrane immunogenic protein